MNIKKLLYTTSVVYLTVFVIVFIVVTILVLLVDSDYIEVVYHNSYKLFLTENMLPFTYKFSILVTVFVVVLMYQCEDDNCTIEDDKINDHFDIKYPKK